MSAVAPPPAHSGAHPKRTALVLSVIAQDHPALLAALTQAIVQAGCNLEDSRMLILGAEFSMTLMLSGNWSAIAKLEASLGQMEKKLGFQLITKRTESREPMPELVPYMVEVIARDQPGIVHHLANFFSERGIRVQEMATNNYQALFTSAPMCSAHFKINIPSELHIASLRQEFIDFCDELNLDAIVEPIKI